jgi:hypothetical protein
VIARGGSVDVAVYAASWVSSPRVQRPNVLLDVTRSMTRAAFFVRPVVMPRTMIQKWAIEESCWITYSFVGDIHVAKFSLFGNVPAVRLPIDL